MRIAEGFGPDSAGNKGGVVAAFNKGTVKRFGAKNSRFPQGCTDYERWKTATEQYPVTYCNRCSSRSGVVLCCVLVSAAGE